MRRRFALRSRLAFLALLDGFEPFRRLFTCAVDIYWLLKNLSPSPNVATLCKFHGWWHTLSYKFRTKVSFRQKQLRIIHFPSHDFTALFYVFRRIYLCIVFNKSLAARGICWAKCMFATAYLLYASVCGSLVLIDRFSQDCLVIAFYILFRSWANFMKIHRRVKTKNAQRHF